MIKKSLQSILTTTTTTLKVSLIVALSNSFFSIARQRDKVRFFNSALVSLNTSDEYATFFTIFLATYLVFNSFLIDVSSQ